MVQFWALCLLGWALCKTVLTAPLRRSRALAAFSRNYAAEGLLPVLPEVHAALATFGGCIACGRCDRIVGAGEGAPLSQLVRGWTRSLPDARLSAAGFARFSDGDLAAAEALCPTGVPIAALCKLTERQAARMNGSVAPA